MHKEEEDAKELCSMWHEMEKKKHYLSVYSNKNLCFANRAT